MTIDPRPWSWRLASDRSGSTLPELVVAAALLLTATAMAGGTVLAPLTALGRVAVEDDDQYRLRVALDSVAVLVRAARPTLDGPAVVSLDGDPGATTLRLRFAGAGGAGMASLMLSEELVLTFSGSAPTLTEGLLVNELDPERNRIELLTHGGAADGGLEAHDVVAVHIVLVRAGHEASRTVHLRMQRPLAMTHR